MCVTKETLKEIKQLLDSNNLSYKLLEHEHVHTSSDAAKTRGTKIEEAAKALVLQTKSGKVFMCVVSGHLRLDLKKIKKLVGEKNCSLAHPDVVFEKTGCKVGTVPPFPNLFELEAYVDSKVFDNEEIVFSAGTHNHSIRMNAKDWQKVTGIIVEDISK